jgi:hypothetical protein
MQETDECLDSVIKDSRVNTPEIEGTAQASKETHKHEGSLLSKLVKPVKLLTWHAGDAWTKSRMGYLV